MTGPADELREALARWLFERDYRERGLASPEDAPWDEWAERNQDEWREEAEELLGLPEVTAWAEDCARERTAAIGTRLKALPVYAVKDDDDLLGYVLIAQDVRDALAADDRTGCPEHAPPRDDCGPCRMYATAARKRALAADRAGQQ